MLTTNFSTIEWKNGTIENPTYFIASNLNAINKSTKNALDELEKELTGDNPLYSVLEVYQSLNLIPDKKNNNAINPNGRLEGSTVGVNSIGIGINNTASGDNSIAIGNSAKSTAEGAIAIGQILGADNAGSIHIGKTTIPSNNYSISVGYLESALEGEQFGKASISIGKNAKSLADNSVQFGEGNNNIPDSLQFLNQNFYRVTFVTDEVEQSTITTNIFGAPIAENVSNKFLGNSLGVSDTIGEGDNSRKIEDIFEEKSTHVKCSTNTINSIPVGENNPTEYKKIYYDDVENVLRTNILGSSQEKIPRELLLFENESVRHNIISEEKIILNADIEGDAFNIKTGDLIKVIVRDTATYDTTDSYEAEEVELKLRIGNVEVSGEYRASFNTYRYIPSKNDFTFKSCRLVCKISDKQAQIYFLEGGKRTGSGTEAIANSEDYPIIKRIYKML